MDDLKQCMQNLSFSNPRFIKHYEATHGYIIATTWDPHPSDIGKLLESTLEEYVATITTFNHMAHLEDGYGLKANMTLALAPRFESRTTPILKDFYNQPQLITGGNDLKYLSENLHQQMKICLTECAKQHGLYSNHIGCLRVDIWRTSVQPHVEECWAVNHCSNIKRQHWHWKWSIKYLYAVNDITFIIFQNETFCLVYL